MIENRYELNSTWHRCSRVASSWTFKTLNKQALQRRQVGAAAVVAGSESQPIPAAWWQVLPRMSDPRWIKGDSRSSQHSSYG